MSAAKRMPAAVAAAARAVAAAPESWSHLVADVGRQWAWEWWNVLGSRPTRLEAGIGDDPAEAVTDELWRLLGRPMGRETIEVPWLTPTFTVRRQCGDHFLAPGEFPGASERIVIRERLAGVVPGRRRVRATGSRPADLDVVITGLRRFRRPVGDEWSMVEQLDALAHQWLTSGQVPERRDHLLRLGLTPEAAGAPINIALVAGSAVAAFMTAHRHDELLGLRTIHDLDRLAAVELRRGIDPAALVLVILERTAAALSELCGRVATPPGWGGQVVLATPSPGFLPAPRIEVDRRNLG